MNDSEVNRNTRRDRKSRAAQYEPVRHSGFKEMTKCTTITSTPATSVNSKP